MPHNADIVEIHKDLLKILEKFNKICIDNNIKYSLHGGTLLGCIRENGFIPWDDDVDISIKRQEYCKLRKILQQCDGFILDESTNRFPQLWMVVEDREPVWLDIFIWDPISENKIVQKLKIGIMCFFLAFLKTPSMMKLSTESKKYVGLRHLIIFFIYLFGRFFPNRFKHNMAEWCGQHFGGSGKYIHRSNDLYAGMKLVLPSYVMEEYVIHDFEDCRFMISRYYDSILISSYGMDYMTPVQMTENEALTHSLARKFRK